jgi:hypothetical protein
VIDSKGSERDPCEKPVSTFSHRALARFPLERNRSVDKRAKQQLWERILMAKVCQLLHQFAPGGPYTPGRARNKGTAAARRTPQNAP